MSKRLPLAAASLLSAFAAAGSAAAAQPVHVAHFTDWNMNPAHTGASWIDLDADDSLWFTDQFKLGVAHFDPATGELREWFFANANGGATAADGIASDGLGRAYFATPAYSLPITNAIRRIDGNPGVNQNLTTWVIPGNVGTFLVDNWNTGNVFFTEYQASAIGMLNTSGAVDGFGVPADGFVTWAIPGSSLPEDVAVAPNLRLYFSEDRGHKIGELDPLSNTLHEWAIPGAAAGNDRIRLRVDERRCHDLQDPDSCSVWFLSQNANQVQRLDTRSHTFTSWAAPTVSCAAGGASCLANGLDIDAQGRVWFSDGVGYVWMLDPTLDPGTSTVVADAQPPLGNATRLGPFPTNPAAPIHAEPEITHPAAFASAPATVPWGAGFSGWPVSLAARNPAALQLDSQDHAWYANYGDPPGFGQLIVTTDAPPVAVIAPVAAVLPNTPVQLDGTGSSDPENDAITYLWTLAKPVGSAAALSSDSVASPIFTTDVAGDYTVTLTVTDSHGAVSDPAIRVVQQAAPTCKELQRVAGSPPGLVSDAQITYTLGSIPLLDLNQARKNWGALATGTVGRLLPSIPAVAAKLLLRFDLGSIPPHALVLSSTLLLKANASNGGSVNLSRVNNAWSELNGPGVTGVTWYNFGAGQGALVQGNVPCSPLNNPITFDAAALTQLTQEWVDLPASNKGVIASGESFSTTFATSETANEAARPKLVVCYLPR
ncbi:MAG: DNRLRE domain-containing protein [Minicystis sp.]